MRPGDWVAIGLVTEALLIDAFLIKKRHDPISSCIRSSTVGKVAALALCGHLVASIPGDPLTKGGDWLTARWHQMGEVIGHGPLG